MPIVAVAMLDFFTLVTSHRPILEMIPKIVLVQRITRIEEPYQLWPIPARVRAPRPPPAPRPPRAPRGRGRAGRAPGRGRGRGRGEGAPRGGHAPEAVPLEDDAEHEEVAAPDMDGDGEPDAMLDDEACSHHSYLNASTVFHVM